MFFQIKKIILWPKNKDFSHREIEFELNKINIITGASRTGKSAIIPIIDYCLGSKSCSIPVNTIRDACEWFGVLIQLEDRQLLIARAEPGNQKSTDNMFMLEDKNIKIPNVIKKNTTRPQIKRELDELVGLTFLEVESEFYEYQNNRPAFRDLMAFCFQTQNIVANANTLFYKADTTENRNKLISIFPYILGAVSSEILSKKNELNNLNKELKAKEKEFKRLSAISDKWRIQLNGWLSLAKEVGLLDEEINLNDISFEEQIRLLGIISLKNARDSKIVQKSIIENTNEMIELRKEEEDVSLQLMLAKKRLLEMTQLINSVDDYRDTLQIQQERLNISRWLKKLSKNEEACPIFGLTDNHPKEIVDKFYERLNNIEKEIEHSQTIPASFEKEFQNVEKEIKEISEKLTFIKKRIAIHSKELEALKLKGRSKYSLEEVSRFLGQIEYVKQVFEGLGDNSQINKEIDLLRREINRLVREIDEKSIEKRMDLALNDIKNISMKLLPHLDLERPNAPIELDYKNLTLNIQNESGRQDYLWEIGSGSNWLSYHIAITLALQIFFSNLKKASIPNFIVYDQPSQVYFPSKKDSLNEADDDYQIVLDEDREAVRKIFYTMQKAINEAKNPFQIIVLEHADKTIYGDILSVHEVEEWRGEENKLVPNEWLQ